MPEARHPPPEPQTQRPTGAELYEAMLQTRSAQARMRHEAMLAPYAQMFSFR